MNLNLLDVASLIVQLFIMGFVGLVALSAKRLLKDVDEMKSDIKAMISKHAAMEVKVDALWGERTDSGVNHQQPYRRRRNDDTQR